MCAARHINHSSLGGNDLVSSLWTSQASEGHVHSDPRQMSRQPSGNNEAMLNTLLEETYKDQRRSPRLQMQQFHQHSVYPVYSQHPMQCRCTGSTRFTSPVTTTIATLCPSGAIPPAGYPRCSFSTSPAHLLPASYQQLLWDNLTLWTSDMQDLEKPVDKDDVAGAAADESTRASSYRLTLGLPTSRVGPHAQFAYSDSRWPSRASHLVLALVTLTLSPRAPH
jgi:hypothetical protein